MIRRKGNKFLLEVFTPEHAWKMLGIVITIHIPDAVDAFLVHFKKPDVHFYIKGQGYPINYELLKMLRNALIDYILIPEDGKTGFRVYIAGASDYLHGESVHEPRTEEQRCIKLRELDTLPLDKEKLRRMLYG